MKKAELTMPKRYEYLLQFVDLANLLSPRKEWPTPEEIAQLAARAHRGEENWFELDQQRNAILGPFWKEAAHRFPPTAADKLDMFGDLATLRGMIVVFRRPTDDPLRRLKTFNASDELYEAAYTVRTALRIIARGATTKRKDTFDLTFPTPRMSVQIFSNGILYAGMDFYRDFLSEALDGVDANRIRECPECGRLFIARREDQPACGSPSPCANRLRQREFRKSHPAYHKRRERSARTRTFRAPRIEPLEFLWQQGA